MSSQTTHPNRPAATPAAAAADALELVREDLERVERQFARDTASPVQVITEIGQYLQTSGGKRIRPALVLLTSRLVGCETETMVRLAAVVEMIHDATLVHDDILDGASTRRGRPSTNVRWGSERCVLAGDWLYMQAFKLSLETRNFAVLDALIALTQEMVEGEMLQLEMQGRVVSREQHLELMRRKTARLFEVSSQIGSLAAHAPAEMTERLGRFGYHLGLAFQMVDDILDFTASEERLGKPVGNDLREGKMTLPAIYAWQAADGDGRAALESVLHQREYDGGGVGAVRSLLEATGALERARQEARQAAAEARRIAEGFPAGPYRDALVAVGELVVAREY